MNEMIVTLPPERLPERRYIWDVLLAEGLGLTVRYRQAEGETTIRCDGADGCLTIRDGLLSMPREQWLTPRSLPARPIRRLASPSAIRDRVPDVVALYGSGPEHRVGLMERADGLGIDFDLAGSAFFMLTRYEELVPSERDRHGRLPSEAMATVAEGLQRRAIVNEYLLLLSYAFEVLWPGIKISNRAYRVFLTHDVDSALFLNRARPWNALRAIYGDVVYRKDPGLAARRIASTAMKTTSAGARLDVYNTYELLMDISEEKGLKSAFYFICGGDPAVDGDYAIDSPWCLGLLRSIAARGHEIGLHPSYASGDESGIVASEFQTLRHAAALAGVRQDTWGGRHHYLRWNPARSWGEWAQAGLSYDSSIGFADIPGFRSGFCFDYPVFDVSSSSRLPLRERPLLVMEKTVFPDHPSSTSGRDAVEACRDLARTCKRFGGDFTLLWHNSKICSRQQVAVYRQILQEITA